MVLIEALGFGYANVVVAVPQAWIDVRTMADLDDVATAFRAHARPQDAGRDQVREPDARLLLAARHRRLPHRRKLGATEGAPAAGTAELIVDITTTGATLAANGLKMVDDGVMLRSQANLVAARGADWGAAEREIARLHPRPHRGAERAHARSARCARAFPAATTRCSPRPSERFGVVAPFGGPTSSGMLTLHCPPAQRACARELPARARARTAVSVGGLDYVFTRDNPLLREAGSGLAVA